MFLLVIYSIFSDPPERLTIEGPEELTQDKEARFTCKASASNMPSQLTFKLTSHHADMLDELTKDGLVEIIKDRTGINVPEKHIERMMADCDKNDDNQINYEEFVTLMTKSCMQKRVY